MLGNLVGPSHRRRRANGRAGGVAEMKDAEWRIAF